MTTNIFKSLVNSDYTSLLETVRLCTSEEAEELILMQSVEGHAHEGDGVFTRRFPETTNEDVVVALGLSPDKVKKKRQQFIDEVIQFADKVMRGENVSKYLTEEGAPLFGINLLADIGVQDPASVLTGIYLGSKMDRYIGWRQKAEEQYNLKIGGGECIGVNRKRAYEDGITLESIAKNPHSENEIEKMKSRGLLCFNIESSQDIVSGYVRKAQGNGTSDDLAVLLAGRLYGFDAAVGLYLCDAIDTWDKYVPFIFKSGQDEQLGEKIERKEEKIKERLTGFRLPREEEVLKFISVIAEANYKRMISSSQRYFLQINQKTGLSAVESHFEYLRGNKVPEMHIGYYSSDMTNHDMYATFEEMFNHAY